MSERDSSRPLPKIYISFITKIRLEQRLLKLKLNGIFIDNETRVPIIPGSFTES